MTNHSIEPPQEQPVPAETPLPEQETSLPPAASIAEPGTAGQNPLTQTPSAADQSLPASETVATAHERAKAPELKEPSRGQRIRYSIFSPETRTGRFMRALLRGLALVVGLFALGLLVAYLLLYRPADQQLQQVRQQATQSAADLQQVRQELDQARQAQQSAQDQSQQAQDRLGTELTRVQVLRANNALTQAQMAVQAKDKAGALKAINTAESIIKQAQPRLEKVDSASASTLQALITLAKNDLDRDLKLAGQDLDRMQTELAMLDNKLK